MLRFFSLTVAVAMVAVISWGCADSAGPAAPSANSTSQVDADHADHDHADHDHADHAAGKTINVSATFCGACGEEKGAENCLRG